MIKIYMYSNRIQVHFIYNDRRDEVRTLRGHKWNKEAMKKLSNMEVKELIGENLGLNLKDASIYWDVPEKEWA